MEGEQRDERSEAHEEETGDEFSVLQLDVLDLFGHALHGVPELATQHEDSNEENHGSETKIERGTPSRRTFVAAAEETDHHEGRDEGQFVEGEERDDIVREESARGPCGDEERGDVPRGFRAFRSLNTEDRAEGDKNREKEHHLGEGWREGQL